MAVQLPTETSYYYETSTRGTRIVICIPRREIERRVASERVRPEIIDDYPDGLDFEVSNYELDYFARQYELQLEIDPHALQAAFQAFLSQSPKTMPRNGFLSARFLDSIADRARQSGVPAKPSPDDRPAETRRRQRRQKLELQRFVSNQLSQARNNTQLGPESELSDGEDVAQVLSRLQWRSGKGGR
jgi:hypothetical protein